MINEMCKIIAIVKISFFKTWGEKKTLYNMLKSVVKA